MGNARTSICVKYKYADGWHVFASDDLPGLYVASEDGERAFNDIPRAIEMLLKLDEGISCKATPEMTFKQFLAALKREEQQVRPELLMSDQRYLLQPANAN